MPSRTQSCQHASQISSLGFRASSLGYNVLGGNSSSKGDVKTRHSSSNKRIHDHKVPITRLMSNGKHWL